MESDKLEVEMISSESDAVTIAETAKNRFPPKC